MVSQMVTCPVVAMNSELEQGPFWFYSVYSRACFPATAGYSLCTVPEQGGEMGLDVPQETSW